MLSLLIPHQGEAIASSTVVQVHVAVGTAIRPGTKLFDVRFDHEVAGAMDCQPTSFFRVVSGESGWVREIAVSPGTVAAPGSIVARISSQPDEPLTAEVARPLRVSLAAILHEPVWPA